MVVLLLWAALCTIRVVWACTWTGGGDEKWNGGAVAVGCTVHDDGLCGHAHGQEEEMRNEMVVLLPWAALCTIRVVWACTWTGGRDEKWNGGAVAVGGTVHD
jgi:Flp pilus assembly protein protease CpaA